MPPRGPPRKMREFRIWGRPELAGEVVESDVPTPGPRDVLIRVIAAGLNPKDWKFVEHRDASQALNAGDDMTGVVDAVGPEVWEFRPGDRVAAFHVVGASHGAYADYALAPAATTFPLPPGISFEAGAGLPLAAMTAALALYQYLGVPLPWASARPRAGDGGGGGGGGPGDAIVIYGGASAVGAYALQLARLSGLRTIVAVAGAGADFVRSLRAATHVVDYRRGRVEHDILAALGGRPVRVAFDAVCSRGSYEHLASVLVRSSGGGHLNMVDPPDEDDDDDDDDDDNDDDEEEGGEGGRGGGSGGRGARRGPAGAGPGRRPSYKFPPGVRTSRTYVASAHGVRHSRIDADQARRDADFAYAFYRYLAHLLAEGRFRPHPFEVLPGGLEAVVGGVRALREGRVSAKKLVARWADCCSLGRDCNFAEHFRLTDTPQA